MSPRCPREALRAYHSSHICGLSLPPCGPIPLSTLWAFSFPWCSSSHLCGLGSLGSHPRRIGCQKKTKKKERRCVPTQAFASSNSNKIVSNNLQMCKFKANNSQLSSFIHQIKMAWSLQLLWGRVWHASPLPLPLPVYQFDGYSYLRRLEGSLTWKVGVGGKVVAFYVKNKDMPKKQFNAINVTIQALFSPHSSSHIWLGIGMPSPAFQNRWYILWGPGAASFTIFAWSIFYFSIFN